MMALSFLVNARAARTVPACRFPASAQSPGARLAELVLVPGRPGPSPGPPEPRPGRRAPAADSLSGRSRWAGPGRAGSCHYDSELRAPTSNSSLPHPAYPDSDYEPGPGAVGIVAGMAGKLKTIMNVCTAAILGWGLSVFGSISTCVQLSRNVTDPLLPSTICCVDRYTLLGVWGGDQNESEACRHITDMNETHSHVSLHYYKCGCLHAKARKV
jgi:hypothetical protein